MGLLRVTYRSTKGAKCTTGRVSGVGQSTYVTTGAYRETIKTKHCNTTTTSNAK